MISYRLTTTLIGVLIFILIFLLVRRGKLQEKYALVWFGIGFIVIVLGMFPSIIDQIATITGVTYPPALLFVLAVAVLLIQVLYLFIFSSQNEIKIKSLMQQVAVLNRLVEELKERREDGPAMDQAKPASNNKDRLPKVTSQ